MNKTLLITSLAALMLVACGKQDEQTQNIPPTTHEQSALEKMDTAAEKALKDTKEAASSAADTAMRKDEEAVDAAEKATEEAVSTAKEATKEALSAAEEKANAAKHAMSETAHNAAAETREAVTEMAVKAGAAVDAAKMAMSREDALALANKSGCLACHAVDKKVVGPAWQDVAARYRDQSVKDQLVAKVSTGGKGNWTDVTGGIPMPPYSPRVSKENIEKLVDFILSL